MNLDVDGLRANQNLIRQQCRSMLELDKHNSGEDAEHQPDD